MAHRCSLSISIRIASASTPAGLLSFSGQRVIDFAKQHPDDPQVARSPALTCAPRIPANMDPKVPTSTARVHTSQQSRLRTTPPRYPKSPWTAKTPYFIERRRGGARAPLFPDCSRAGKIENSWGCSSAGRAPRSQRGGQRFDPAQLHQPSPALQASARQAVIRAKAVAP